MMKENEKSIWNFAICNPIKNYMLTKRITKVISCIAQQSCTSQSWVIKQKSKHQVQSTFFNFYFVNKIKITSEYFFIRLLPKVPQTKQPLAVAFGYPTEPDKTLLLKTTHLFKYREIKLELNWKLLPHIKAYTVSEVRCRLLGWEWGRYQWSHPAVSPMKYEVACQAQCSHCCNNDITATGVSNYSLIVSGA